MPIRTRKLLSFSAKISTPRIPTMPAVELHGVMSCQRSVPGIADTSCIGWVGTMIWDMMALLRRKIPEALPLGSQQIANPCLLYTSDAADERSSVDLGGRRIIK